MAELPSSSFARTVNELGDWTVGTPVIWPVLPSVKPGGRIPEYTAYVYGGEPPVTPMLSLYSWPSTASGRLVVRKLTAPPDVEALFTDALTVEHWLMFCRLHTVMALVPPAMPYRLRFVPEIVELTIVGLVLVEM